MIKVKSNKSLMNRFWRFLRKIILLFFVLSIFWVVLLRYIPIYFTPLMIIRTFESISEGEASRNIKCWVPINDISPNMVQAVVASEDNLFLEHSGFSFKDMQKAIEENKKGKSIRGGSTISQQTAKNVFLWPQKSYIRKGLEAYFTVLIEFIWSKERIMEVYLNVIEMGKGVYGVEAASETYFNKPALKLTKYQAALIAACLPNPRRFKVDNPSPYVLGREIKIVSLMTKINQIDFNSKVESKKTKSR